MKILCFPAKQQPQTARLVRNERHQRQEKPPGGTFHAIGGLFCSSLLPFRASFVSLRNRSPGRQKTAGRVWAEGRSPVWVPGRAALASYPGRGIRPLPVLFSLPGSCRSLPCSGRRSLHWNCSHRMCARRLCARRLCAHRTHDRRLCHDGRSHCFCRRSPGLRFHCSGIRRGFRYLFRSSIKAAVNISSSYDHLLYDTICKGEKNVPERLPLKSPRQLLRNVR